MEIVWRATPAAHRVSEPQTRVHSSLLGAAAPPARQPQVAVLCLLVVVEGALVVGELAMQVLEVGALAKEPPAKEPPAQSPVLLQAVEASMWQGRCWLWDVAGLWPVLWSR